MNVRLAIVGTGLVGASVGLAAKRAGVPHVGGIDADPDALALAVARGAVDLAATSIEATVADAQLVVIATPVATIRGLAADALGSNTTCTVTDVGSTKATICAALERESRFVGGHPLVGSETQGPAQASAELFDDSPWFLTPHVSTDPERYRLVQEFVGALGADTVEIEPTAHDRLVALVSHLPHALANLLVNQVGAAAESAAPASLRDMTRVAGANPRVWVDIFLDNAEALVDVLGEHRRRVEELEEALRRGDPGALTAWIDEAALKRPR
jgi:prephenate dehydrogenase